MPTRKKVVACNGSQEHASPKFCRQQRKVSVIAERKVKELITSAKKQKSAGICLNKIRDVEEAKDLITTFEFAQDENHGLSVAYDNSLNDEKCDKKPTKGEPDTIFSPAYHHSKDGCARVTDKDFLKVFQNNDQSYEHKHVDEKSNGNFLGRQTSSVSHMGSIEMDTEVAFVHSSGRDTDSTGRVSETADIQKNTGNVNNDSNHASKSCDNKYGVVGTLSAEVSAIYLAMQHSKLECADEQSQDSTSTEGCADSDDSDDFDDFDPYMFIKDLPDLSAVVPKFRPVLLPKQTRSCPSTTLVLDLDETLVHSSLEPCPDADFTFPVNFNMKEHTIYVRCRPYLKDFLERVATLFETIIFTASQGIYAEQLLNILDPRRKLFRHRVYRESCVYVDGNYLKDLSVLGRDLSHVAIIDNSPQAFGFQLENGIPIESWFDDRSDQELLALLPFLESLVGVDDVRPIISRKFNLRERVATSTCFSLDFRM